MSIREIATEFTDLWHTLETSQINTMLAKNVSYDLLEFFSAYAQEFVEERLTDQEIDPELRSDLEARIPNLMIIGYIIRVLEERVQ